MTECQHATAKWLCARDATWGLYQLPTAGVRTGVGMLVRSFCGQHKPQLNGYMALRNIKLPKQDWLGI